MWRVSDEIKPTRSEDDKRAEENSRSPRYTGGVSWGGLQRDVAEHKTPRLMEMAAAVN